MERVIAALRSAGIAERDIQTNSVSLNPEYVYENNKAPRLTGYTANNTVTIRFRDILNSGKVLDVLVAQGANQINGPNLVIEKPAAALDEARANAVPAGPPGSVLQPNGPVRAIAHLPVGRKLALRVYNRLLMHLSPRHQVRTWFSLGHRPRRHAAPA